jgi:hypothetical protein
MTDYDKLFHGRSRLSLADISRVDAVDYSAVELEGLLRVHDVFFGVS